jgi:hypothetical protein
MSGEVTAGQPATDAPRMLLVFDRTQEDPIRPVQVGAVLSSLEEIFLVTLLRDAPPPDHHGRDWAWDYDAQSLHINLAGLTFGSPLQVLVGLPWHAYTLPFCAFAYGIAHVFGAPTTAAPVFDRAREDFWSSRLACEEPKPEWLEWQAWLELKHEEVEQAVPFRLSEVDIALSLPPEAETPA